MYHPEKPMTTLPATKPSLPPGAASPQCRTFGQGTTLPEQLQRERLAESRCWFALRDLTRHNAKCPGYKLLGEKEGLEVFTPMHRRQTVRQGVRGWEEVPFMQDLLFVRDTRGRLDPIIGKTETLQYRFVRGGYRKPMTVPDEDMERFILAVRSSADPRYYRPEELTPEMYGRRVRIIGGSLDGYEGHLLSARGSKVRRLLVELPNYLTAAIEIQPELIEVLK